MYIVYIVAVCYTTHGKRLHLSGCNRRWTLITFSRTLLLWSYLLLAQNEVIRAVYIKIRVLWDIKPCQLLNSYRHFGHTTLSRNVFTSRHGISSQNTRTFNLRAAGWSQLIPRNTVDWIWLAHCFASVLIIRDRCYKMNEELRHRWAGTQWILKNTNETINIKLCFSHVEKPSFRFNKFTFLQISNAWMRNLFYLTQSIDLHWNLKIMKSWSNNNVRCVHWNMYKAAS